MAALIFVLSVIALLRAFKYLITRTVSSDSEPYAVIMISFTAMLVSSASMF